MMNSDKLSNIKTMRHGLELLCCAGTNTDQMLGWSHVSCSGSALQKGIVASAILLALSACEAPMIRETDQTTGFVENLPEQVVALAAPHQDLQAVRVMPDDGCYWYRHVGPVETTMLPLRTLSGSPICTPRDRG